MAATSYSEEDDDSECESVGGGSRQRHATSCLIIPLLTVDSSRSNHIDISGSAKTRKDSTSPPEDGESGSSSRRASISRQVTKSTRFLRSLSHLILKNYPLKNNISRNLSYILMLTHCPTGPRA